MMSWAIWITGLPGSGKSTISQSLLNKLDEAGIKVEYLRLDEFRKKLVPSPKYTEEEREYVYEELVKMAFELVSAGKNTIIDATAHRRRWREDAKKRISNFIEVYISCELTTCIERESGRPEGLVAAELYKRALERRKTGGADGRLGEVVGVDVPFEEGGADVVIESDRVSPEESAEIIFRNLVKRGFYK
jgi:adenylylsulfate kinase